MFRARDMIEERDVVVKVPFGHSLQRPLERERFRREIEVLGRLDHPHIVRFLDAGTVGAVSFVVLESLPGGSLRDRLTPATGARPARRPLIADVASWLRPIADACDFIHAAGVLHRDLKPENVLFDARERAHVSDFGLAKAIGRDESLTPRGFAVGTPEYLAPEQLRDSPLTGRCDQYALGTILFEAFSGRLPFDRQSLGRLVWRKGRHDAPSLLDVATGVPRRAALAVDRALRIDPDARFETCASLAAEIVEGESPLSSDSRPER